MIVDTSALVAVVLREPGYESLLARLSGSPIAPGIGAPSLVELGMVLSARLKLDARLLVSGLLEHFDVQVVPFSADHWQVAVGAFHRFGRGRHPAGLNFGDCLTYAVASLAGQPLLYTGDDFAQTDLEAA